MRDGLKIVVFISLAAVLLFAVTGCVGGKPEEAPPIVEPSTVSLCSSEDIAASLTKLHDAAMPEITDEIEAIDSQITKIDEKLYALIRIQADISSEISLHDRSMEEIGKWEGYHYYVEYPAEGCAFFDNVYYELVKFRLTWQWSYETDRWKILAQDVLIKDKETGNKRQHARLDAGIDMLSDGKSRLIAKRTEKFNAKEKSIQVLNDTLDCKHIWEIEEVSETVYLAKGYGLGYGEEEHLALGNWYYDLESESLEPRDSASIRLGDILTASLK